MSKFFSFQWHITDDCDQRCKHCYIFSENNCKALDSMNREQLRDTFYNCLDFCKVYDRMPYFYITGGDPILHPNFWELLKLMNRHKIKFTILGNPFHLNDEVCRELLQLCDKKFKEYEAQGCATYFNKKDHLWTLYEYETGEFKIPENVDKDMIYGGCNCGNCHLTILPNGDIFACRRVQNSKVGNVFDDRSADVWVGEMEQYRDYDKFEKCSKCELKAWCRGCPAVASGKDGNFYSADPQCWKEIV